MAKSVSKLNLWFKHFTNETCKTTFLNRKEAARAAGYKTKNEDSLRQIGCQNFTKLTDKINIWLDESGLSERALKIKLLSLIEAKETKFMKIKGYISSESLPDGARAMGTSGVIKQDKDGEFFADGDTLIAIDVDAVEIQRKTLDMALKVRGMYAPEKHEIQHGFEKLSDEELDAQIKALSEEVTG